MKATREDRIANMQKRSNTQNQILLDAINKVGSEFNSLFFALPAYIRDLVSSVVGLQNIPNGEHTLEDFYTYDYNDILHNLSASLLNMINNIQTALEILLDVQDEMNLDLNADEKDTEEIDIAVELMQELIAFGTQKQGATIALTKVTEMTDMFTDAEIDRFIDIIA